MTPRRSAVAVRLGFVGLTAPIRPLLLGCSLAVLLSGCGGGSGGGGGKTHSAYDPSVVSRAEAVVHSRVEAALSASRARYSEDAQVFPSGTASCTPFSQYQLDCDQQIQDRTDPWKGTSKWRASVDPTSGGIAVKEHGGQTLDEMLEQRSEARANATSG